jgi:hypothetical protein
MGGNQTHDHIKFYEVHLSMGGNQTHDHIKLYGVHLSMESNTFSCVKGWGYDVQQYFSYMVAVSFIGGGNQRTWRKPPTCHKSLTNFITCCIEYTLP